MAEIVQIMKYNEKTKAWEIVGFNYDSRPLYAQRLTGTGADLSFPALSVPAGNIAIITGIKVLGESSGWWSFSGAISDLHYQAGAGADWVARGDFANPVAVLDEGETLIPIALAAGSGVSYGVVIYGMYKKKAPE